MLDSACLARRVKIYAAELCLMTRKVNMERSCPRKLMLSFYFQMETDPAQQFRVEVMNHQDFVTHSASRQLEVATLSRNIEDYPAKHMMLDQAVQLEKFCAEGM